MRFFFISGGFFFFVAIFGSCLARNSMEEYCLNLGDISNLNSHGYSFVNHGDKALIYFDNSEFHMASIKLEDSGVALQDQCGEDECYVRDWVSKFIIHRKQVYVVKNKRRGKEIVSEYIFYNKNFGMMKASKIIPNHQIKSNKIEEYSVIITVDLPSESKEIRNCFR